MNEEFWGEMLGVLKDVSSYLEKQDATQERAKVGTPPKIAENPKPIKGGEMPSTFKPADKIAKEFVTQDGAYDRDTQQIDEEGDTLLKEDEDIEEIPEGEEDWEEGEGEEEWTEEEEEETPKRHIERHDEAHDESIDELKSLLKDISNHLAKQSNMEEIIKSEIKKSMPNMVKGETDRMLRKMGFVPTRPDVSKLDLSQSRGIETIDEVKSGGEIKKSKEGAEDVARIVEDLSRKTWSELGQLREKTDGFHPFAR